MQFSQIRLTLARTFMAYLHPIVSRVTKRFSIYAAGQAAQGPRRRYFAPPPAVAKPASKATWNGQGGSTCTSNGSLSTLPRFPTRHTGHRSVPLRADCYLVLGRGRRQHVRALTRSWQSCARNERSAGRRPSTWVQWSASVRTRFVPMLTIGSTAITSPGSSRKSPLRAKLVADKIRHLRVFVHLAADAVADEGLDHRETVRP